MLKIVLAGAVAVPVAAAATVAATGVVVVDVQEPRGGQHLVIPVPLAVAQVAATFVPDHKTRVRLPSEAARYLPVARAALDALAGAEDGELVRVEEPGQQVSIRKEGSLLRIQVHDGDQKVDVQVPIAAALSVLAGSGDRISASRAVWALQSARLTRIADVQGPDGERVRVTVY